MATDPARERGLQDYRKKLLEHKEVESRLKESKSNNSKKIYRKPKEVMLFAEFVKSLEMQLSHRMHKMKIEHILIFSPQFSSARTIEGINEAIR